MTRIHGTLVLAVLFTAAAGLVLAADTSTLTVKTIDSKGSPLPGVTVQVENSKGLSSPQAKTTDPTGTATFIIPSGPGYKVTASLTGFNTVETADLKAELGKVKTILYTMAEQLKEKVIVRGGKVVDLDDNETGKTTFTDQFVEDLPVFGHSYQNVLTLAPGVNNPSGDGNPNVHGARERDFKATVDGVSNVDPLTGTFMSNINPDAIEEIEVVTTGASVEDSGAVGGFAHIVTKQGGNTFETTASIYLRHSVIDGNTNQPEGGDKIQYHDVRPAINLTGPVIKDKLFFALFHQYRDVGTPVSLVSGGGIVQNTKGSENTDKLTWQASPKNKVIFQAQADPRRYDSLGIDAYTDPLSGYDRKQGGPTYQVRWNAQVSSVFNLESQISASHTGIAFVPISQGIKNNCAIDELGFTRRTPFDEPGGQPIDEDYCLEDRNSRLSGSYYDGFDDDRIRYALQSKGTYFLDNLFGVSHTLKAGVSAERTRYKDVESYRSYSLFDEATGNSGNIDAPAQTGGGFLQRQVYDPGGYPEQFAPRADGSLFGAFIEDQFRPHPNVSITVGLRAEQETVSATGFEPFDPEAEQKNFDRLYNSCRAGGQTESICALNAFRVFHKYERWPTAGTNPLESFVVSGTAHVQPRVPENFRISNTNISRRFSIQWDPFGDQKTKLFAQAGRGYGFVFLGIAAQEEGPNQFIFLYQVDPANRNCHADENGHTVCDKVRVINQTDAAASVTPASVYQVDRSLRTPYVDEYTAGFSREIAPETSITVQYIRRHFRDQFQAVDLNHIGRDQGTVKTLGCYQPITPGPTIPVDTTLDGKFDDCGGRRLSIPGSGPLAQPTFIEVPDGIPDLYVNNPFFNQIERIGNYNQEEYKAYQIELVRRLHRNWTLEGSYVWSKAVGEAEDYISSLGQDPTTKLQERGPLDYDQRHFVKVNVTTQIPLWNVRLGSAFSWATGLPYSRIEVAPSLDQPRNYGPFAIAYSQSRTSYPTNQRNDERNDSYWLFNVNAKKDFTVGKANIETSVEVFNLLNNNYVIIDRVRNGAAVARHAVGRQFQVGAKLSF